MYEEGDIADGPNGQQLVFRGGQWVPMSAPTLAPMTIGQRNPYALPKDAVDLEAAKLAATKAAASAPFDARISAANATKAEADAKKSERDLADGSKDDQEKKAKLGQLNALINQINETQSLFNQGVGSTSGVRSLLDYLPNSANAQFDTAANSLEERATAAFRVPGSGDQSDADAARIAAANKPNRFAYDAATTQQLKQLRERVDTTRAALGLGPADWKGVTTVATGATKTEQDPKRTAVLDALIRSGADIATINTTMESLGGTPVNPTDIAAARAYLKKNPGFKGSLASAENTIPTSFREQVSGSAPGAFIGSAINNGLAGIPSAVVGNNDVLDAQRAANPNATFYGGLVGSVAGMTATEGGLGVVGRKLGGMFGNTLGRARVADAAFGSVAGATAAPDNRLLGAATGGLLSVAGGYAGDKVAAAAGRSLQGVTNPEARYLYNRGVPLTSGQAAGGALKAFEDRLTGVSGIGDLVGSRRSEGLDAFERLAFNDASVPLQRQTVPLNVTTADVGAKGIEQLNGIRTQGYNNAVVGRSASVDPRFQTDYVRAHQAAQAIPRTGDEVADEINAVVPSYFQNGSITGENAQAAIKELKGIRTARQSDALGHRTGQAVRDAEAALTGLFERQAPGFANDLSAANTVNTNYKVLEKAVARARNTGERFMPSQLNDASVASATRFGGNPASTSRPFYNLAQAGQAVLPSKIPDSGTAGRLALLALPGAVGGGYQGSDSLQGTATGAAAGGTLSSLALGGLLAAGGTKVGQRALVTGLMKRDPWMVKAGEALINQRRIGGILGGGLVSSLPSWLATPPQ